MSVAESACKAQFAARPPAPPAVALLAVVLYNRWRGASPVQSYVGTCRQESGGSEGAGLVVS